MRRAVVTIGGTVAGLAALFSFRTHSAIGVAAVSTPPADSASASASASASGPVYPTAPALKSPSSNPAPAASSKAPTESHTLGSMTAPASHAPTTTKASTAPASTAPTTKAPTSAPATKAPAPPPTTAPPSPMTYTGPTENTQYGQVEVQITVASGKITGATDLIGPADNIGANAVSQLNSEVLSAQNANVQSVSGASYTSQGYIQSLQSAVDQAGL